MVQQILVAFALFVCQGAFAQDCDSPPVQNDLEAKLVQLAQASDEEVSRRTETETQSCTHLATCYICGFGHDFSGKYKYSCGFKVSHNCPGSKTIYFDVITYRTPEGRTYTRRIHDYDGNCI